MSSNKRMSTQQMQALAAQSAAKPRAAELVSPGDIVGGLSVRRLRVLDVHQYEHNPRKASSSALSTMRESIRAAGLINRLTVCRLPDGRFVTAKGGGTRLEALHQLASETDEQGNPTADAKRFEYLDFDEVKFVSDVGLLAAHLAENIEREDMCFWDTAAGVVMMRKEVEKELGRALGGREFFEQLKKRGLSKVVHENLSVYDYAVSQLYSLSMAVLPKLSRNDVRDHLRPTLGLLESFWSKHSHTGEFTDMQQSWLSLYDAGPDANRYSIQGLVSYLQDQMARHLGYELSTFERLLSAHKLDPAAPLEQLKQSEQQQTKPLADPVTQTQSLAPTSVETGDTLPPAEGGHPPSGAEETEDQRVSREGLENLNRSLANANTLRTGLPDGVSGGQASGFDADTNNTDGFDDNDPNNGQFADPIPGGVKTAATHQLNFKTPTGPLQIKSGGTQPSDTSQAHVPGLDPRSSALQIMRMHLDQLADQVGIRDFVVDAPAMPYGFFMEIPPVGLLGADSQDLAVQGWWLLANLSGQLPADIDAFLASGMLPDTGPDGYLQCLADVDVWQEVVLSSLGGQTLLDAGFVVQVLTQPSAMADLALELTAAMKQVNELTSTGSAGAGGVQ